MALKIKIGKPIKGDAPGKLLKQLAGGWSVESGPATPPNSKTSPNSPHGAEVKWKKTPVYPSTGPTANADLVLHPSGSDQSNKAAQEQLSTGSGVEIRKGTIKRAQVAGKVEGVIPFYPFIHDPDRRVFPRGVRFDVAPFEPVDPIKGPVGTRTNPSCTILNRIAVPWDAMERMGNVEHLSKLSTPEYLHYLAVNDRGTKFRYCMPYGYLGGPGDFSVRPNVQGYHIGGFPAHFSAYRVVPGFSASSWSVKYIDNEVATQYRGYDEHFDRMYGKYRNPKERETGVVSGTDVYGQVVLPSLKVAKQESWEPAAGWGFDDFEIRPEPTTENVENQPYGTKIPLPVFTFVGDDIALVYCPPLDNRLHRGRLFGTLCMGYPGEWDDDMKRTQVNDIALSGTEFNNGGPTDIMQLGDYKITQGGSTIISRTGPDNKWAGFWDTPDYRWWLTPDKGILLGECNGGPGYSIHFNGPYEELDQRHVIQENPDPEDIPDDEQEQGIVYIMVAPDVHYLPRPHPVSGEEVPTPMLIWEVVEILGEYTGRVEVGQYLYVTGYEHPDPALRPTYTPEFGEVDFKVRMDKTNRPILMEDPDYSPTSVHPGLTDESEGGGVAEFSDGNEFPINVVFSFYDRWMWEFVCHASCTPYSAVPNQPFRAAFMPVVTDITYNDMRSRVGSSAWWYTGLGEYIEAKIRPDLTIERDGGGVVETFDPPPDPCALTAADGYFIDVNNEGWEFYGGIAWLNGAV